MENYKFYNSKGTKIFIKFRDTYLIIEKNKTFYIQKIDLIGSREYFLKE